MGPDGMRRSLAVVLTTVTLTAACIAEARDWERYRRVEPLLSDMSLDTAVGRVRERTGGRILSADTVQEDGRRVHEVKVLTDQGKVRRYRIDQDSGEQLGPTRRQDFSPRDRGAARPPGGRPGEPASPQRHPRR